MNATTTTPLAVYALGFATPLAIFAVLWVADLLYSEWFDLTVRWADFARPRRVHLVLGWEVGLAFRSGRRVGWRLRGCKWLTYLPPVPTVPTDPPQPRQRFQRRDRGLKA